MSGSNDDHALQQSPEPRRLKSVARRCLIALIKLIRRVPRVFHALLVLALSTSFVTIVFVWAALSFWPVPPDKFEGVFIRGIGGEIGNTRMSHFFGWSHLDTYWLDRVTAEVRSYVTLNYRYPSKRDAADLAHSPFSKHWDSAGLNVSIPIENLKWRPRFSGCWAGFYFVLGYADKYGSNSGKIIRFDLDHEQNQRGRTGLSEQEVLRIEKLPRLWFSIRIPLWFCVLVTGWYPLFLVVRGPLRRRRRARRGWCIKCGYDLTGNECGVCPECGKPIVPKSRRRR